MKGLTDNLGNTFVLTRLMSSKFPLIVILGELAAQLKSRGMVLDLEWAPRDQNEEADALTNGDFSAFSPSKRIEVKVEDMQWLVLNDLLDSADQIYKEVRTMREKGATPVQASEPGAKKRATLRQRDPW